MSAELEIPAAAYTAAADAIDRYAAEHHGQRVVLPQLRPALLVSAAAPIVVAAELRRMADRIGPRSGVVDGSDSMTRRACAADLRARADELAPAAPDDAAEVDADELNRLRAELAENVGAITRPPAQAETCAQSTRRKAIPVADIALPKRLLAAAEAVQALGRGGTSYTLRDLASQLTSREGDTLAVVAAIDAALSDGATQEADQSECDRLREVERAAQVYVMAGLCGDPDTSAELTDLIRVARTDGPGSPSVVLSPGGAVCGDVSGPSGVGGECALPSGHPHIDGIGGQWVSVEPSPTWYAAYLAATAALEALHGRCHQALRLLRHIQTAGDLEAAQEWTRQAIEVLDAPHVGRAEPLRCGHHAPWPSDPSKGCILPPGHTGWHQGIDDCGWSWPVPAGPPTALQEELADLIAALLDSHPDQADTQEEL